ncbi:MAG: BBP7 family outer membrane beta-barrel protein [Planctomycetota bacterium]|nr:BBP7 family outer membrane beta-barrel protein [Planctomycetota bacterium]
MQLNFGDTLNGDAINTMVYLGGYYTGDAQFRYTSDLYSGEVNYLLSETSDPLRLTSGFRYARLNEEIDFTLFGDPTDNLQVENDLYGWQLGLERSTLPRSDSIFSACLFGKPGIYFVDSRLTNITYPGVYNDTVNDSQYGVAFIGELGVKGSAQITERFSLDAGYQLMYIEGVALAGEQATSISANTIPQFGQVNSGGLLYQGFMFGGTLLW